MPYLYSQMSKDKYLAAMKRKLDNPLMIFDSRVTGIVFGPFFAVAHYQPYEWNRKITSECNRAWGFVKESHGELEIRFLRGKGMLAPGWLLIWTLVSELICLISNAYSVLGWMSWGLSVMCALTVCIVSAVESCLTEAGESGLREVNKFLEDPENYYV